MTPRREPPAGYRIEHDALGEVLVPADHHWGAQTERAVHNFPISGRHVEPTIIRSLARVKGAAAAVNGRRGPAVVVPGRLARWAAPLGERVGRRLHTDVYTPVSIGTLLDDPIVDGSKAATELGHHPRPLEDSVRDTVRWFEREGGRRRDSHRREGAIPGFPTGW